MVKMTLLRKRFHPCGGFNLAVAVKWLAPANIAMLFIGTAMLSFDIIKNFSKWLEEKEMARVDFMLRLSCWIVYVIHLIIGFPMDFMLWGAIKTDHTLKMKIWSVINFFNTNLAMVGYIVRVSHFGIHFFILLTPYVFYCIYRFYTSVVIYYRSLEVEEEQEMIAAARMLTEAELQEFEEGLTESQRILEQQTRTLIDKVQYLRYKREEFEIDIQELDIEKENPLGNGTYGVVYRAVFNSKAKETSRVVAVKTFESGIMDAMCFKALLSELKVMTYLGHHDHVLELVGAVTVDIRRRSLLMVLEYCPFGSLLEYLRASRGLFTNLVKDGEISLQRGAFDVNRDELDDSLSTLQLIQWTKEIISGMAYLEEMKVVHGDLALRNLLLTENKQIKISDFGLARQLYQYSVYVKRQNVPLPWRWLSLESIVDMQFSSKSDVWAFAIVLHELFTLGEVPYSETKQFTLDFIDNLKNGMRLEQTPLCPNLIYHCMTLCWHENPDERPTFNNLQKVFQSISVKDATNLLTTNKSLTKHDVVTILNEYSSS